VNDPHPPASILLGREVVSVHPESGLVHLTYTAKPEFANRHGTVQGGMIAAMLDSASGFALMAQLPPELTAVTTRLDTSFLRPARLGKLNATARIVSRDERTAEVAAEITNADGPVVAKAISTWRIVKRNR
jgi:uncharacterized protein (TIGR00369 family)